jgi:hypothetical protein
MKKLLLIAFSILLSCSKDEVNCSAAWDKYFKEVAYANGNVQKINIITQSYNLKYPGCGFK